MLVRRRGHSGGSYPAPSPRHLASLTSETKLLPLLPNVIPVIIVLLIGMVPPVQPLIGFNGGALSRTLQTLHGSACEGETLSIKCPESTVISVQYAKYGRSVPSRQMCPPSTQRPLPLVGQYGHYLGYRSSVDVLPGPGPTEDTNCLAIRSLEVLLDLCEDHAQCQVLATSSTFRQDPCPSTSKYLEVHYKCRPNEFERLTVCEGEQMELSCKKSSRIAIYSAMFGRAPNGSAECPPNRPGYINCQSAETVSEVRTACQGRKRCDLQAIESTFGNPCAAGINKYLTVTYTCVPKKILKELRRHRGRAGRKRKKDRKKKHRNQAATSADNQNPSDTTSPNQALSESQSTEAIETIIQTTHKKTPSDKGQGLNGQPDVKDRFATPSSSIVTPVPLPPVKGSNNYPPNNRDNYPHSGSSSSGIDNSPPHRPSSGGDNSLDPYRPSSGQDSSYPQRPSESDSSNPYRPFPGGDSSQPSGFPQWESRDRYSPDNQRPGSNWPGGSSVNRPSQGSSGTSGSRPSGTSSGGSGSSGVGVAHRPSGGFEVDWSSGIYPGRTMSTLGPGLGPDPTVGSTGNSLDSVRDHTVGSASGTNLTVLCVNHSVPSVVRTVGSSSEIPVGIIKDWFSTWHFLQTHQEKAILYMVVGVCFGLIVLLLVILGRVCVQLKRNTHAKLDISEPTHSRNVSRLNHTGLETPMLDHSDSIDRIEVVRFEPRGTLRSGYHSTLHSDSGDRSLCNYYG